MNSSNCHAGQKLKPANWPAKVADALRRLMVYEKGEP